MEQLFTVDRYGAYIPLVDWVAGPSRAVLTVRSSDLRCFYPPGSDMSHPVTLDATGFISGAIEATVQRGDLTDIYLIPNAPWML